MMWGFGTGLWWMPLVWFVFIALVVSLLVVLVRPTTGGSESRAADILDERFARGEIDRDEFESRRAELTRR
jgi:putative membrane protein